jgi:hypothetical protein
MTEVALIETSFADAIGIIAAAAELPEQTRRHWMSSLRQIGKALDKPLEVIPARYSAVGADMAPLHQAPLGVSLKTLQNHKSNVKGALLWLSRERGVPAHGRPLDAAWFGLQALVKGLVRWRLSSFMRFCSANNFTPSEVNDGIVEKFLAYRNATGMPADDAFRRLMARAWNSNVGKVKGWPSQRLEEPAVRSKGEIPWEHFPTGLRSDADQYLARLAAVRRTPRGSVAPLAPSTIKARRAELQASARMAVRIGEPIEHMDSLGALLAPGLVERILDAYWQRNGATPKHFTINLACRFLAIARETGCLSEADCKRLDEIRSELENKRVGGMTDKNIAFLRQVLTPGVWQRVVRLPFKLMKQARRQSVSSPVRSAVLAQIAVAIAILSVAPVRLANLTAIRLGFNLIKPDGPASNYWLMFPDYDVKNKMKLDYPLPDHVSRLINEYVGEFRPTLLRGRNEDWLFPGQRKGAKGKTSFSGQIVKRIAEATGLRMTVHQFRHAAGALILKRRPGEYELVRLLLGHRSVQTTMNAYIGLETISAAEIFGQVVMEHISDELLNRPLSEAAE